MPEPRPLFRTNPVLVVDGDLTLIDPDFAVALDVLRMRKAMAAELGQSRADEDGFVRDELVVGAHQLMDAATSKTGLRDDVGDRLCLVRACALLVAEIERRDRAIVFPRTLAQGGSA